MLSRPLRLLVALVAAVAVALAVLAPPTATGSSYDAAGAALEDRRGGGSRSAEPWTVRFEVVNHNVERRQSAIDVALRTAARTGAPVVLLQEVCWWQARAIRQAHPDWTVGWKADASSGSCLRNTGLEALADRGRRDSGLVAIWTGGARGAVTARTFRHQGARRFDHGLVCVSWRATGTVRRACSTHLVNASKVTKRRGTQFRQAREVRRWTGPWVRRGNLVIVGGDFNAGPASRTMDHLYAVDGAGRFIEATGCPRAVLACRRSLSTTFDGGSIKIDYVFFSANRVPPGAPHSLRVVPTLSDHHLLTGWARVRVRSR
ncbi:MAG: endonuclease/exonuclease/phosphatase family protein [Nocardioides sp.]|nr:endonuclease/exonuclease/phosphatase family protein [Nocardioides sp.]